jgi:hypothetical protein
MSLPRTRGAETTVGTFGALTLVGTFGAYCPYVYEWIPSYFGSFETIPGFFTLNDGCYSEYPLDGGLADLVYLLDGMYCSTSYEPVPITTYGSHEALPSTQMM